MARSMTRPLSWFTAWQRVRVAGPSMTPTLRNGDLLLVRRAAPVRPGDVVLAMFWSLPGRYVVKRAARPVDGGWWLSSDNTFAPGDSEAHGAATVYGRAVLRFAEGSLRPRRIR
jgi:phage repressor protein C with HTH and peptisase S24 domain